MTREGYIQDYISGKEVKATPEEMEAVQVFSRQLVEDYGYPKAHIQTKPQFRVKARPSDTKKEYPVDIALFSGESRGDDDLHIIVECKRKNKKDGLNQLKDYLRLSQAYLGVWFNGEERLFIRKVEKAGKVTFDEIPNIPRFGETIEDIGKFRKKDLTTPHNLKVIFRAIRNHLAGNTVGVTRDEVLAQQLINIIFCKIYDEKYTKLNELVSFRAGSSESAKEVSARIKGIFEKVKSSYDDVIDFSDKIILDDKSITYIVGELQNYSLMSSERDVIADAFETFIGPALKGGHGQFFTPRNVIRLIVKIINPGQGDLIIDPACGSGGFLVESLKHVWDGLEAQSKTYGWKEADLQKERADIAGKNIKGIEKDDFLSKVAKAYMAIIGDGRSGIFCEDSLETPSEWKGKTRQGIGLGEFDIVLTNPPFGKDIKVTGEEKLAQYDLAGKWKRMQTGAFEPTGKRNKETRPEIAFIERCLQLLKVGGRLAIVLPETFFHAPRLGYVMQFMRQHNIQWIIDLPHNTFRPHNNAKCLAVILEKGVEQGSKINFAVAEEMGHNHQGKEIYRWDPRTQKTDMSQIWDDIQLIIKELDGKRSKYVFETDSRLVKSKNIFVPRYYWETKSAEVKSIAASSNYRLVSLEQLISEGVVSFFDGHGSPPAEYKGKGDIPYIRVKDIVNWEIYKDPTACIPENVYEEIRGENKGLREGDILYVRRGSYRIGSVAMVSNYDRRVLLTREILVLRVTPNNKYGLTPHYLLFLLSHPLVQMQSFSRVLIETTLPNMGDRWKELELPFFEDEKTKKKALDKIKAVMDSKWHALKNLSDVKSEYGGLIT